MPPPSGAVAGNQGRRFCLQTPGFGCLLLRMKTSVVAVVGAACLWPACLRAQSVLVARVSDRQEVTTVDQQHVAWLEAGKSYWVVGDLGWDKCLVFHDSGLKVILPKDARFRIINGGRYDDTTAVQVTGEGVRINKEKSEATYEATLGSVPKGAFVAVQVYADDQPCGAKVEQVTEKKQGVVVDFRAPSDDAKITYAAHYFVDGNELRQIRVANDW